MTFVRIFADYMPAAESLMNNPHLSLDATRREPIALSPLLHSHVIAACSQQLRCAHSNLGMFKPKLLKCSFVLKSCRRPRLRSHRRHKRRTHNVLKSP
jgi:hypothetical protein